MKRMKFVKHLIALALCTVMLLGFGTASAAEDSEATDVVTGESAPTETENSNVFEELCAAVSEFSGEIASALAFLGSLIVAVAYKRGLMPTVKSGIGAIGGAVSQLKDSTESYSKHQDELLAEFTDRLTRAEEVLEKFGNAIEEIAEKFGYELLARIPMDPKLSALVDRGMIELMENDYMDAAAQAVIEKLKLQPEA